MLILVWYRIRSFFFGDNHLAKIEIANQRSGKITNDIISGQCEHIYCEHESCDASTVLRNIKLSKANIYSTRTITVETKCISYHYKTVRIHDTVDPNILSRVTSFNEQKFHFS